MAYALTIMPSMIECGSPSSRTRSLNVPGSISSALHTRYFGCGACSPIGTKLHFKPVGKPAPPRPCSEDCLTVSVTSSGSLDRQIAVELIVDHHRWRRVAGTQADGGQEGERTVGGRLPQADAQSLADAVTPRGVTPQ